MAYIGKEPQVGNYSVLDALSASSTASYTMQLGSTNFTPESANHLIVSLNGVIQKPGSSYTVSGSTITFSSSLTSSDSIDFIIALGNVLDIGTPSDNTIATAKIVDDAVTPAKASFFNADISAADLGAGLHVKTADSGGSANSNADELVVEGSGSTGIQLLTAAGNGQGIYFGDADDNDIGKLVYNHDGNKMQFFTNASERMRIDSSGRLLIGTTSAFNSNGSAVHVNVDTTGAGQGAMMTECASTSTTFHQHFRNGNGGVGGISTNASATQYVTSSDYRLKENVNYDFDATSRLKELKPARFNFKADADTTVDGFLAHEVSSIVPEAISGDKDAVNADGSIKPQGIDQSKLVPLLVKTIQELEARITELENA